MLKPLRALCVLCLAGLGVGADCGGDEESGGGGGSSPPADASCDQVCDSLKTKGCFYAGGDADCRMSCNGWETQYVAAGADYCHDAWESYKSCVVSETLQCPDDLNPDWNALPCRGHWDHFQNYCINKNATPDTPCTENTAFDTFCSDQPGKPKGKSCFGNAPAECSVGGTINNSNLYCCP